MSQLKIGIVGSGGMARHHADRFSELDTAEIVAVASRNAQTGTAFAQKYGVEFVPDWRDLVRLDTLDGVVICTHNDSHGEIAVAALTADKHLFVEYPLARSISEGESALELAKSKERVLRVSHPEAVSNAHKAVKERAVELGQLLLTSFVRLTPGRGARPEILFNIPVSGRPAHFFIYHIYPIVDIFGGAAWVEGGEMYEGLNKRGQYRQFANTVTVGFKTGGIGQWTWSGGIEVNAAEQHQRYVLTKGTLTNSGEGWKCSTQAGIEAVPPINAPGLSLQELWLGEILSEDLEATYREAETALEAIRISLSAEQSMRENRRVVLG
jgi:biliverdin reductase